MARIELAARLPRPVAYVLAGGAAYGAVQAGQLMALAETDLLPDFVVGTSVGSLNGAVLAESPESASARLGLLWASITRPDVFGKAISSAVNIATRKQALIDHDGLQSVIENALTVRQFRDLAIPLTAVTTDFDTGEVHPISHGDLVPALLASSAIPLVFPSVEWQGRTLVDGGLVANVPIGVAAAQGAASIVVLDCGFTLMPPSRDDTFTGKLLRSAAIMAAQQVRRDLRDTQDKTLLYLPGPWPMGTRPDDFRRSTEIAAAAYGVSIEWLRQVRPDGPGRYGTAPADLLPPPDGEAE